SEDSMAFRARAAWSPAPIHDVPSPFRPPFRFPDEAACGRHLDSSIRLGPLACIVVAGGPTLLFKTIKSCLQRLVVKAMTGAVILGLIDAGAQDRTATPGEDQRVE